MFVKMLGTTLVALIIWAIAAHSSESAGKPRYYTVKPYDTLWSIAASHYGGDPRDAIFRLEKQNGLDGAIVRPGERLLLP
jgi:predicted Zn-dependent protease